MSIYNNGELVLETNDSFAHVVEGHGLISQKKIIKYDPDTTYVISVDLKSIGKENSAVLLSAQCFSDSMEEINSHDVHSVANTDLIIDYAKIISIRVNHSANIDNWKSKDVPKDQRMIGFYYDGNTNHLPDYVHKNYIEARNDLIELELELPADVRNKIVSGVTVIRNHYAGPWHVHPFSGPIKREWTHIVRRVQGINLGTSDTPNQFRKETKYFRVVLHYNWGQTDQESLLFKNFSLYTLLKD